MTFSLYPNPATGSFTISAGKKGAAYNVEVLDLMGKLVKELTWSGERLSVDISGYSKGVYIVRVSNGSTSEFKKLIVE